MSDNNTHIMQMKQVAVSCDDDGHPHVYGVDDMGRVWQYFSYERGWRSLPMVDLPKVNV